MRDVKGCSFTCDFSATNGFKFFGILCLLPIFDKLTDCFLFGLPGVCFGSIGTLQMEVS